jgi:hypothetical protein
VERQIQDIVAELLQVDRLTSRLRQHCTDAADLGEARTWIEEAWTMHPTSWWQDALRTSINDLVRDQRDDMTAAVRRALLATIQAGALRES